MARKSPSPKSPRVRNKPLTQAAVAQQLPRRSSVTPVRVALLVLAVAGAGWLLVRYGESTPSNADVQPPVEPRLPNASVVVPEALRVEVLRRFPHDPEAFTQGLFWQPPHLVESTGLNGRSSLRRADLDSGDVLERVAIPEEFFAEGLAQVEDELFVLTWQNREVRIHDNRTLAYRRSLPYDGEGWGLCFNGSSLVMSNGTDEIVFRNPRTFRVERSIRVKTIGRPTRWLNELECVGDDIYANVWQRDEIVRIRSSDGVVTAVIDASRLLSAEDGRGTDVLNGIAYVPEREHFLITGKLWPYVFEVVFRR